MTSNQWKIVDLIKRGLISHQVDDTVVLFRRKSNGYPKGIKDGVEYTVRQVYGDSINVSLHSSDGIGWLPAKKIHITYMIPKYALRDLNLNNLI